ncbi:ECF transporter S component [Lachnoclostridium sp. An14]|uniref:ECF transporter S component n=1 Tax=Lachnoclostridium sp. An14 TaxID=1965562 RepID=UPI000B3AEF1D|nr:ECF transporter S component [Lachnoclostridium sp. An14]OUQ12766.1 ECF transporter S component [Lachnoclostridium sp. An14]
MNTVKRTRDMVMMAALVAIMLLMTVVPVLGYIPLGFMNATIIHIPVIVGAILLGPKKGAVLGLVFGFTSMWKNTALMPNLTSFVFTPFITMPDGGSGGIRSVIICLIPRMLIGVVGYYAYRAVLAVWKQKKKLALTVAGVAGSITNTLLVMNLIYFLFGNTYAEAARMNVENGLYAVILGVICLNGIPEAILAGVLTALIVSALWKVKKD